MVRAPKAYFAYILLIILAYVTMATKSGASLGDLVTQALSLHKEGNLMGALSAYERVIPLLPAGDMTAKLSANAGSILMQMGEYERARGMFETVVAGHPDSAQAHFNLAVVLTSKLGVHDVAMKHCIRAMKLDPNMHKGKFHRGIYIAVSYDLIILTISSLAFHLMGNILQNMGKDAQAEKYFIMAESLARQAEAGIATASEADRHATLASLPIMGSALGRVVTVREEGLNIEMTCISERPLLFSIKNLASPEECEVIRARAEPHLELSYVVGAQGQDTGGSSSSSSNDNDGTSGASAGSSGSALDEVKARRINNLYRDSKNTWLAADDTLRRIQRRISHLTGIPLSYISSKAEEMQVVKYDIGGSSFKIHHDASTFQPRLFTALVYLSGPSEGRTSDGVTECSATASDGSQQCANADDFGGETWFPYTGVRARPFDSVAHSVEEAISKANSIRNDSPDIENNSDKSGSENREALGKETKVRPSLGDAVLFFNYRPEGSLDPAAVHAGLPTSADAEKWIANYWVHYDPEFLASTLKN